MWDVSVCVACLATDARMYSMSASRLLQPYQQLAGVQFGAHNDYLPQKLCWECAALVNKFNLFRQKCERAYLLLQDIYSQHDEILERHVYNEIDREQHLLSSPLSIARIPSYTVNVKNVAPMKDKIVEHLTYSVKPEVVKVEYSCPKSEPVFKSEPFENCDEIVQNLADDDDDEGVEDDVKEVIPSEGVFKFELNVTKEETPSIPCFSGKKETIPPDAWTEIILTQEQVSQLYKQKKNSLEFEKATLKCELCYEVFKQPQLYEGHMLKHEPSSGSYECDFCKFRYKTRNTIVTHMNKHMKNFKCNICGVAKTSQGMARFHFLQHKKLGAVLKPRQRATDKREASLKKPTSKSKRKRKRDGAMKYRAVLSILTQEQMMEVVRERQLAKGYDTAPFKCHLCFKVFLETRTYSKHMTLHDPARGEFECDICKVRVMRRRMLQKHITNLHLRKYTCKICSNVSYSRGVARNHYEQHMGTKFMCHICARTFREVKMQEHILKMHPSDDILTTSHVCGECGASYPTYRGLFSHKQYMHQVAPVPEENAPYCEECKVQFATRKAWTKHVLNSERHKDLQKDIVNGCRQCGEAFDTIAMLKRHKREQHPDKKYARDPTANMHHPCALVATVPEENAPYCEECKVQFATRKAWTKHVLNSERHKDLQKDIVNGCRQCGEVFHTIAMLKRHKREQHPRKQYARDPTANMHHPCALCGKLVKGGQGKWAHHRSCHPGEPYPRDLSLLRNRCEQCGKLFKAKTLLDQHKVTHSGPPPLQCSLCPRAFYMQAGLKLHISTTHSEERPYKCDACDMSFKVKYALKRHLYVHTGERPYACDKCEKAFTTRDWLQLHIRKVHNKEHIPYKPRIRKRKPSV